MNESEHFRLLPRGATILTFQIITEGRHHSEWRPDMVGSLCHLNFKQ